MEPGTVLLGKYRVEEVLGVGGMGRVVRAAHLYLQQSVAIKVLLPNMAESPSTVARFLREAQATVRLRSEHIARVIDVGTMPDGLPFMVMEYLDGNDLNQILRHHGPQSPAIVCDLMLQACEGMAEAHSIGIVHRDIKPSNFFITRRPDGSMLLKILDFGISKASIGVSELTGTQTIVGTPTYMAPEQMRTARSADHRSDIWSMGVVMYQLLTGRPPFSGESYAELVLKVGGEPPEPMHVTLPPGLGEVILRCLDKKPELRPQNVGELARSIAPYTTDPQVAAAGATRATRILQPRTSHQPLSVAAVGGLATLPPAPLSPAQLTPPGWPPTNSSVSHGAGQVTHQTRTGRGWMIFGIATLCILAGAGGYIANEVMGEDGATAHAGEPRVIAPPPKDEVPLDPPPPPSRKPEPAVAAPTAPIEPTFPAPTPKLEAKPIAKADPKPLAVDKPKPIASKPKPIASRPRPTAKPTTKPKPRPGEGLFDSRK
ncbi:MAG: protein kinase [Kofleriaceae bacterium]